MGCSGVGSFDNDDALDWLDDLFALDQPSVQFVRSTFDQVLPPVAQLDRRNCCYALAAADFLTFALGRGLASERFDCIQATADRLSNPVSDELIATAIRAVRAVQGESTLSELWEGDPEWHADVTGLIQRLRPSA